MELREPAHGSGAEFDDVAGYTTPFFGVTGGEVGIAVGDEGERVRGWSGGGRIVCLSSVHAYQAWKDWTPYGIAKAGLQRMVKGLAVDLQGSGITANCIAPGAISNALPEQTEAIDGKAHDLDQWPAMKQRIPTPRGGLPSDIANAVLYLTSDLGSYVNGETILVDGGLMAAAGDL